MVLSPGLSRLAAVVALALATACLAAAPSAVAVVGGSPVQVQASPWTVYVQRHVDADLYDRCTGTIVDATHVVTAAHCLYDDSGRLAQPADLAVDAGLSDFFTPTATDLPQFVGVSSFRVHPGYRNTGREEPDDVAVLTLASALDLSGPAVRAVSLPQPGAAFPAGSSVSVAGFGRQDASAPASGPLAAMTAAVDAEGRCGELSGTPLVTADNAVLLCASSRTAAVCSGDSGGGVVTTIGPPTLVGVVDGGDCTPGDALVAASVGSPEILAFLEGDDAPPTAPRFDGGTAPRLASAEPPLVGGRIACASTGWQVPVRLSYAFLDARNGRVLQRGTRTTFRVPARAKGAPLACQVTATDAGGTAVARTAPTDRVERAPRKKRRR